MKKFFFLAALVGFCVTAAACAQVGGTVTRAQPAAPAAYPTAEEFLKAEGGSCKVATDGCNTMLLENGQLGPSTMMWCENMNRWSCKQYGSATPAEPEATAPSAAAQKAADAFAAEFARRAAGMGAAQKEALKAKIAQRARAAMASLEAQLPQGRAASSPAYQALGLVARAMGAN